MNPDAIIELGYVSSAHGLTGEVMVRTHNKASELPAQDQDVLLIDPLGKTRQVRVVAVRAAAKGRLVRFAGVESRADAEALRGCTFGLHRRDLPALEAGAYYWEDLPGMPVRLADGTEVGHVESVFRTTTDILVIRAGDREIMVPVVDAYVASVGPDCVVIEPVALEEETE